MNSVKVDELERRLEKLSLLESRLKTHHLQQGYICGLVNGLRIARGVISGENMILEREEVQPRGDNGSCIVLEGWDGNGEIEFTIMKFDSQGGLVGMERV